MDLTWQTTVLCRGGCPTRGNCQPSRGADAFLLGDRQGVKKGFTIAPAALSGSPVEQPEVCENDWWSGRFGLGLDGAHEPERCEGSTYSRHELRRERPA